MKRYVSTSFWDDDWVQSLNFTEKGLYLYLLTNPLTNIAGVYKLSNRRIVFDTGLEEASIEKMMKRFEEAGKAYRHGEFIILPSYPLHQRNANIRKGIRSILLELEPDVISFLSEVGYRYPLDEFLRGTAQAGGVPAVSEPGGIASEASEEMRLFMRLWQTTKDKGGMCIFQVMATIERPRDWERYWRETPPTAEQIERAFRNFADGIDSGAIARRYIPATPDRFALKGGIARYQEPVKGDTEKSGGTSGGDMLAGKYEL